MARINQGGGIFRRQKPSRNLDCSQVFAANNFVVGEYADKNNQMRKMYDLTRDGFTFLAMGFTGINQARRAAGMRSVENSTDRRHKL